MAELFKNVFNEAFFKKFTRVAKEVVPTFNTASFTKQIYTADWEAKALKERMRHITITLKTHLAKEFKENAQELIGIIRQLQKKAFANKV